MKECRECNMYKHYKQLLINNCESVFDAVVKMGDFLKICEKSCPKNTNNCIKN